MNPDNQRTIEEFWIHDLGLAAESLPSAPSVTCTVQHRYSGMQLLRRGDAMIFAAPPSKASFIESIVQSKDAHEVFNVDWLRSVLSQQAEIILGPAELHYADATTFRFSDSGTARALSPADADA